MTLSLLMLYHDTQVTDTVLLIMTLLKLVTVTQSFGRSFFSSPDYVPLTSGCKECADFRSRQWCVCVCARGRWGGGGGESPGDKIFERLQMWDVSAA